MLLFRTIETPSESENSPDVGVDDAGPSNLSDVFSSKIASMDKSFTCLNSTRGSGDCQKCCLP